MEIDTSLFINMANCIVALWKSKLFEEFNTLATWVRNRHRRQEWWWLQKKIYGKCCQQWNMAEEQKSSIQLISCLEPISWQVVCHACIFQIDKTGGTSEHIERMLQKKSEKRHRLKYFHQRLKATACSIDFECIWNMDTTELEQQQ